MNNGTSIKVIEHFNRVSALPDSWDHNQQYQGHMLKQIKNRCKDGLDIGCGTGEMTRKLAEKCENVIGIDVAPGMIKEALARTHNKRIHYFRGDAEAFLKEAQQEYDVIVSIAAFHHMDYEYMLSLCKNALKKDGLLVLQDLYHEDTMYFKALSLLGALMNPVFMLFRTGKLKTSQDHNNVWKGHCEDDEYNSIAELKEMASRQLGNFKIKRHLFWRYTLIYRKNNGL